MRKRKTVILGIISGLLCAGAVFMYTQEVRLETEAARAEALSRYGGDQLEVCVAQRDIHVGETIDSSNVTTKLWVAELMPENAARSFSDISGRQVTSTILAGEVVSLQRFTESKGEWDIPEGLSALSVPAKDVQTVGGSLASGMRVDIYATGTTTELLAQDVLVITTSTGKEDANTKAAVSWVTLALDPESVQEIITASQKMELYFVLPGSNNKENE